MFAVWFPGLQQIKGGKQISSGNLSQEGKRADSNTEDKKKKKSLIRLKSSKTTVLGWHLVPKIALYTSQFLNTHIIGPYNYTLNDDPETKLCSEEGKNFHIKF